MLSIQLEKSLLGRILSVVDKHVDLTQIRRVPSAAPLNVRIRGRNKHLLILGRSSLIAFAYEISRRNVTPSGASDFGCLHIVCLGDEF